MAKEVLGESRENILTEQETFHLSIIYINMRSHVLAIMLSNGMSEIFHALIADGASL